MLRATPGTEDPLRLLVPRDDGQPAVPAGAYNVAAQLLAVRGGRGRPSADGTRAPRGRLWLTLRAARLAAADPGSTGTSPSPSRPRPQPERVALCRAAGLTDRETQLLGHLARGDTREVARRMFLSALTVQDHLKTVFAKTGTHSRRALLARALGA